MLTSTVELQRSFDFLELVLDEGIEFIAVGVVVCKSLERLSVLALRYEPTGALWG